MDRNDDQRRSILILPAELREIVYEFVLSDYKAATLRAYKLPYRPHWLIRYHSGITSPPLLRVCRLIYFEARSTMLKLLGTPTILVEQVTHFGPVERYGFGLWYWADGIPMRRVAEMRPLENVLPMIYGGRGLRLEVRAPRSMHPAVQYAEDVRLHALLRWIGAVLAVRETPIQILTVLVRFPDRFATLRRYPELFDILLTLRSNHLVIESQPPRFKNLTPIHIDAEAQAGTWKDAERTWAALLKTTMHWPRQPWRPKKYFCLLLAGEWASLWESFGEWLRGEL